MNPERWLPVVGWEGWYEVSDLGRVRRAAPGKRTTPGRLRTPSVDPRGYHRVRLSRGSSTSQSTTKIHRLVAAAFLGPCPPGTEVGHKDGTPGHDAVGNLEYVTHQENMKLAGRMGRLLGRPR